MRYERMLEIILKNMKMINVNVLYRKGRDLILFDFGYEEDEEDPRGLIDFHFCDRHDFDERTESCAKSIFKNFYDDSNDGEEELIDFQKIL